MEAGGYHDPICLHFEEYSVGEAPHACTATIAVYSRKLQGMFRYRLDRGFNRQRETLPEP